MSLPLDEPLDLKMLRQPYPPYLSFLFATSPGSYRLGLVLSVSIALGLIFWTFQIDLQGLEPSVGLNWGEMPGIWSQFQGTGAGNPLLAENPTIQHLKRSSPLGLQLLSALIAKLLDWFPLPFHFWYGVLMVGLVVFIAIYSFQLTLLIFPFPLAGTIATVLSLQGLWSPVHRFLLDSPTLGYAALLASLYYLQERSQPLIFVAGQKQSNGLSAEKKSENRPGKKNENKFTETKLNIRWGFLVSVLAVGLYNPYYLLILAGICILNIGERLAIVPVGRKPQTVQEFLEWSKRQQMRTGKTLKAKTKEKIEWKIEYQSQRVLDFYLPALALIFFLAIVTFGFKYSLGTSLSREQMIQFPEFYADGLWHYFQPSFWQFWLVGERSGLVPALTPTLLWSGFALIFWLRPWGLQQLPLLRQVRSSSQLLLELLIVSFSCFILAHALFLRLGWPQDYIWVINRLVLTIATSIFLTAIIESIVQSLGSKQQRLWGITLSLIFVVLVLRVPLIHLSPPTSSLRSLSSSRFADYLVQHPPKELLATGLLATIAEFQSPSPERSFTSQLIPSQSIVNTLKDKITFHLTPSSLLPFDQNYYLNQRNRLMELVRIQYLGNQQEFLNFLATNRSEGYPIAFWLLESNFFTLENWETYESLKQMYPDLDREITHKITQKKMPFLQEILKQNMGQKDSCLIRDSDWVLINLNLCDMSS